MNEIIVQEKKYINSKDSQVLISFCMAGLDWSELQQLPCWKEVEGYLSQKRNLDNRNIHQEEKAAQGKA